MHFNIVSRSCLLGGSLLASLVNADCHANNCYRALFPCPTESLSALAAATSYCATITQGTVTATNFPSRATSACGTDPSPYISACACGQTCAPACPAPTVGILPDGDFECTAVSPWRYEILDSSARVEVGPPANTGARSFGAVLTASPATAEQGVSVRLESRPLPVKAGRSYLLGFALWFSGPDVGFAGVKFNGVPVKTVDARDVPPTGEFHSSNATYTAPAGKDTTVTVAFEFLFDAARVSSGSQRVDTITLVEL
ncbi:hypothetical protein NKR23_g10198 [Pleurostoma richardsiae]|uniref:Uncharacterized protein n=1 Tax=Pleurostoma richardsiae TaxID=41990 RepID=A0AA38RDL6_9PEZI|nr:hypothetical protein NKR23_g10198 [Pleurostoma richardsiae]